MVGLSFSCLKTQNWFLKDAEVKVVFAAFINNKNRDGEYICQ